MNATRFLVRAALAAASVAATAIAVTSAAAAQPADFQAQAEALLAAAYPADGPGAAVIVTRGGRVIYAGGRGLADLEAGRPITPDSVFRLGSIAKQFTAAIVLQLVAEGRISLDDPISRFFPDFPQPAANATVRQLLNHSSGIQDYSKIPGWVVQAGARPWTTAELVAEVRDRPATSAPGARWEYNNAGYMMLGAIVEQATGLAWHEAVRQRVARPLGLATIEYAVTGEAGTAMVRGYTEEGGRREPVGPIHHSVAHAAGGLVGSVADIARWAQALHHGEVVDAALYREMTSPARLADGSTAPYGFGLRLQRLRGRSTFVHGGAGRGLDTDSVYIPSEDVFVAVFANSDEPATDPSLLTRRLAALAIGEPFPEFVRADVATAAIEPLFGAYRAESREPVAFFERDGRLFLAVGDDETEAYPARLDHFFFGPDRLAWIRFRRGPGGGHVMELHDPGSADPGRALRTGPVPAPIALAEAVLRSYVGTYQTETVAITIAMGENGRLTATAAGAEPLAMRPVSATEFRIDGTPMRLVFHPEEGEVNRFTLYRGARELRGRRTGH